MAKIHLTDGYLLDVPQSLKELEPLAIDGVMRLDCRNKNMLINWGNVTFIEEEKEVGR